MTDLPAPSLTPTDRRARLDAAVARLGDVLRDHAGTIRRLQWVVVGVYAALLLVPLAAPLPGRVDHIWSHVTLFAQFLFWGVWWPFVLVSMILVGRLWCGVLCPEGALTEIAARHGRGRAIPRWVRWPGWPFTAFALTTIYGQMVSVYQYPAPALVVLGGSTVAAIGVGWLWGREKRVWCRFLCPVNGVFRVLAKMAPLHFAVDEDRWATARREHVAGDRVVCAPMVALPTMRGSARCHMCGRCSGYRGGAIRLQLRAPSREIVHVAGDETDAWETALIVFGLMGIAVGAFHWSASPWFVALKQMVADLLVDHGVLWPLTTTMPWFVLTNEPALNDVLTVLDGVLLVAYVIATALAVGALVSASLALATRLLGAWSWPRFHHLAQGLIPIAGAGVFIGLSSLTVTLLKNDGFPVGWAGPTRVAVLAVATSWSLRLVVGIAGIHGGTIGRRIAVALAVLPALGVANVGWWLLFAGW